MHWPVRTSRCDVKPRLHVMWFDRKTVPLKTKNANVCSQFRRAWRKPKLKKTLWKPLLDSIFLKYEKILNPKICVTCTLTLKLISLCNHKS